MLSVLNLNLSRNRGFLLSCILLALSISAGYLFAYVQNDKEDYSPSMHASSFSEKSFFEEAFFANEKKDIVYKNSIKGIVVPHHLLAAKIIADTFQKASNQKPSTIVLISPNHFGAGRAQSITSAEDWRTPYGILRADDELIQKLTKNAIIKVEETPFVKEHGISNIVAFIKRTYPKAKFVPLIMKDTISKRDTEKVLKELENNVPEDALIIASLDFSHYLPTQAAYFHDVKTETVMRNFDYDAMDVLDIDSKPGLKVFLKFLDSRGAHDFDMLHHKNSADLINDPTVAETTSYIVGHYSPGPIKPASHVTIMAFGDIMLDRYIRMATEKRGFWFPFLNVQRLLGGSDLLLGNLEGTVTDFHAKPLDPTNAIFTFDPKNVPVLRRLGFTDLSLANNHSFDFAKAGIEQTRSYLKQSNITPVGDYKNQTEISTVKTVRGVRVGIVGYNQFYRSGYEEIITEIKRIRGEVDFLIVFPHWGMEMQKHFSKSQQITGRTFIDAGADLILGSHPHVIQPFEVYKNKLIVYSMGNFIFDQKISKATEQGLGIGVDLTPEKITYTIIPVGMKNLQAEILDYAKRESILKEISENSEVSESIKEQILTGKIELQTTK